MSEIRRDKCVLETYVTNAHKHLISNPFCLTCNKVGTRVPCTKCGLIFYCSTACQESNSDHRNECKEFFVQIADSDVRNAIHMMLDFIPMFKTMDEFVHRVEHFDEADVLPLAHAYKLENIPKDCIKDIPLMQQIHEQNKEICEKADLAYEIIAKIPIIQQNFSKPSRIQPLKQLIMRFIYISLLKNDNNKESKAK